jgi:uncharacterized membrane protein YraQ (UPF0718 family)
LPGKNNFIAGIIFYLNTFKFTTQLFIYSQKTYQMKLRKMVTLLVMALSLTLVMPALAANETPIANAEKPNTDVRAQQVMNRLKEIRDMDKSHLTSSEKRELRKEVRHIKRNSNGVYLSVGAIIIIVLLLILLL